MVNNSRGINETIRRHVCHSAGDLNGFFEGIDQPRAELEPALLKLACKRRLPTISHQIDVAPARHKVRAAFVGHVLATLLRNALADDRMPSVLMMRCAINPP